MSQPPTIARPRGRPIKADADGREALLRAGVEAFARQGFDGADLRGIAASAGVSPNLVRVHFGHKKGLWTACVERLAQAMEPGLAAAVALSEDDRPLAERLRDAITIMAAFYDAYPHVRDFIIRITSEDPDRAALVTQKLLRPAYEVGRPLLTAGLAAGIIRGSHPALVFVILNGMLSQPPQFPDLLALLTPDIPPDQARARLIETILATLLHDPLASSRDDTDTVK
ncbi:TetR family transcriptional regulator [Novosphingobium sp. Rr 2-17]|uniref:TetR/AcrR family transcriptional regulator n=1 Tax=Novosphingobium sp. Rr 2-17 TaxID=555793 RepID=UPI0002698EFD|nr:TetR/AcrR family transcriptional regulator [Novosphingobium sp. Rr 2-17]EIZ78678.1 TetR family transcriptional regulator [Novosphingobium sp. Rr 2-17]